MIEARPELAGVQSYYANLGGTRELATNACCSTEALPSGRRAILERIDREIRERSYGCGSPIPEAIEGCTVLDLGCGAGLDVYVASALVGAEGYVIGVDMTPEQLEIGRRHVIEQTLAFELPRPNVDFRLGYMEDLAACGIADDSIDVVIANCTLNLSPAKERVFAEIFRVLRPGGELYLADVFADRRVPASLADDPVLRAECLAGAMYVEDFRRLLRAVGCLDSRVVSARPIALALDVEARTGPARFTSMTVRAFKLDGLEDICEDYGQVAVYHGTIVDSPAAFRLDDHHRFEAGKPTLVCGNTAAMLGETRFARHFTITGDRSVHFGRFPCGPAAASSFTAGATEPAACSTGSCC